MSAFCRQSVFVHFCVKRYAHVKLSGHILDIAVRKTPKKSVPGAHTSSKNHQQLADWLDFSSKTFTSKIPKH